MVNMFSAYCVQISPGSRGLPRKNSVRGLGVTDRIVMVRVGRIVTVQFGAGFQIVVVLLLWNIW